MLAAGSDANVKIRDELLDIKVLERVDANGLEQWRPVSKERFPITASTVAFVEKALAAGRGAAIRQPTLDQLIAEIAPEGGPVHVVKVSKTRTRYLVEGCVSEVTEVVADGNKVRTIAIEDSDPAKVIAAVRTMGLDGFKNTSYPRGLKMAVGFSGERYPPMRQAVIDVGTNSVKFHIGERGLDGTWTTIVDRAEVTRLGEGIGQTGAIVRRRWNEPQPRSWE